MDGCNHYRTCSLSGNGCSSAVLLIIILGGLMLELVALSTAMAPGYRVESTLCSQRQTETPYFPGKCKANGDSLLPYAGRTHFREVPQTCVRYDTGSPCPLGKRTAQQRNIRFQKYPNFANSIEVNSSDDLEVPAALSGSKSKLPTIPSTLVPDFCTCCCQSDKCCCSSYFWSCDWDRSTLSSTEYTDKTWPVLRGSETPPDYTYPEESICCLSDSFRSRICIENQGGKIVWRACTPNIVVLKRTPLLSTSFL